MKTNLAHDPAAEDIMEYPETNLPSDAQSLIRAVERGDIDLAELRGFQARIQNMTPSANEYAQINAELAAAWQIGWDQADESVHLDHLVTLLCDLFENETLTPEGQPLPDRHLWECLRVAHMSALKYRQ